MDFDKLSDLPDWEDDEFKDENEEGEEWKQNATREACKALYHQWQQVMIVLNGALDSMNTDTGENSFSAEHWEDMKGMILGDAYQVAVKIKSSEAGGIYVIRMENASIVRKNAQYISSSMLLMMTEGAIEEEHGHVIRDEIDKFKELFKIWVSTFQKDEFEDDWGLFI